MYLNICIKACSLNSSLLSIKISIPSSPSSPGSFKDCCIICRYPHEKKSPNILWNVWSELSNHELSNYWSNDWKMPEHHMCNVGDHSCLDSQDFISVFCSSERFVQYWPFILIEQVQTFWQEFHFYFISAFILQWTKGLCTEHLTCSRI